MPRRIYQARCNGIVSLEQKPCQHTPALDTLDRGPRPEPKGSAKHFYSAKPFYSTVANNCHYHCPGRYEIKTR